MVVMCRYVLFVNGAILGLLSLFLAGSSLNNTGEDPGSSSFADLPAANFRGRFFVTRPDLVHLEVDVADDPTTGRLTGEDGYYVHSPCFEGDAEPDHGAGIYDFEGELVWMQPVDGEGADNCFGVRVQHYQGPRTDTLSWPQLLPG